MFSIETVMYFLFHSALVIGAAITVVHVVYYLIGMPRRGYFFVEVVIWRWAYRVFIGAAASVAVLSSGLAVWRWVSG